MRLHIENWLHIEKHNMKHLGVSAGGASNPWFWLRLWSHGHEIQTHAGLCAQQGVCFRFSLSLCPSHSTPPLWAVLNKSRTKREEKGKGKKKHVQFTEPVTSYVHGSPVTTGPSSHHLTRATGLAPDWSSCTLWQWAQQWVIQTKGSSFPSLCQEAALRDIAMHAHVHKHAH